MARILHIETSTTVCSVCLAIDGVLLSMRESNSGYTHSENLTVFIEEVLKESSVKLNDLNAVAVSIGPGSYTGLRIGLSTAKGLCYALDIPLISIGSLHSLAYGMKETMKGKVNESFFLCPMIDARRMEVYCEIFDESLKAVHDATAKIVDAETFLEWLNEKKVIFGGDGAAKCATVLEQSKNAVILPGLVASSKYMISIAEEMNNVGAFSDVVLSEPFYLKEFIPGVEKK